MRSTSEQMLLIRTLEDRLQALCNAGDLSADLHFNKGQEAIAVGVMAALRETDYLVTHHRTIAHALAKGVPLRPLVAELFGKATGLNGGRAGEMHLTSPAHGYIFNFPIVGTCVAVAAGVAWAVKQRGENAVVAVFHGDAATANGQWHEGLNLAAVLGAPLLLICENNRVAGNVTARHYLPVEDVCERAMGYGIAASRVDGNDIEAVRREASFAVSQVRTEQRPFLLECTTTRLGRHKQGMGDLRSKEELERLSLGDPLLRISIGPERRAALAAEVEDAIAAALAAPDPEG